MIHLNGHILCAIDIETTGLDPKVHEIYEIAIIPLKGDLKPDPTIRPLDILIKPDNDTDIDWAGMSKTGNKDVVHNALMRGTDKFTAADYIVEWFEKINLPESKRLVPLAQNWAGIDKIFITEWLGPLTFEQIFHFHYRDTMTTALYINDRADAHNERIPFPKVNLQYLCSQLGIERNGRAHRALDDALVVAEVYKKLLTYQLHTI